MRKSDSLRSLLRALSSERGGSLLELTFIAPIMLLISGATIDIGRYLRYQQITSTISQELANHVYRKCSDITAYDVANDGDTEVDTVQTIDRIQTCANAERAEAQIALQNALPGSLVRASVFRHKIDEIYLGQGTCNGIQNLETTLTKVDSTPTPEEKVECNSLRRTSRGINNTEPNSSSPSADAIAASKISVSSSGLTAAGNQIATPNSVCKRNRLVVVEVGYAFQPIVSFLPKILPGFGPDKEGTHRETTVL